MSTYTDDDLVAGACLAPAYTPGPPPHSPTAATPPHQVPSPDGGGGPQTHTLPAVAVAIDTTAATLQAGPATDGVPRADAGHKGQADKAGAPLASASAPTTTGLTLAHKVAMLEVVGLRATDVMARLLGVPITAVAGVRDTHQVGQLREAVEWFFASGAQATAGKGGKFRRVLEGVAASGVLPSGEKANAGQQLKAAVELFDREEPKVQKANEAPVIQLTEGAARVLMGGVAQAQRIIDVTPGRAAGDGEAAR